MGCLLSEYGYKPLKNKNKKFLEVARERDGKFYNRPCPLCLKNLQKSLIRGFFVCSIFSSPRFSGRRTVNNDINTVFIKLLFAF